MVTLRNPEAPATSKQLWRLHQLTKTDTRGWDLNMQKASDMISRLESNPDSMVLPKVKTVQTSRSPFTEAHVTIVEGEQRGGKTTTGVARIRDGYDKDCVRVFCENVLKISGFTVISYDRKTRAAKIRHQRVLKLLRIPKAYKLYTPRRIFSNIHLFGLKYTFCPSFTHIMQWLKTGVIVDAWLLVDEAYVGMNARESMGELGKELEKQYFQLGKMQVDVIIITPMARLVDWTMRTIPTERISCSYNPRNHKITLTIRKKGIPGERKLDYDARQYWKNFKTNERIVQ